MFFFLEKVFPDLRQLSNSCLLYYLVALRPSCFAFVVCFSPGSGFLLLTLRPVDSFNMAEQAGDDSADRNVEMWKIKKLIKSLEAARGYIYMLPSC